MAGSDRRSGKGPRPGPGSGAKTGSPKAAKEKSKSEGSPKEKRELERWFRAIKAADDDYNDWERRFHPRETWEGVTGLQWPKDLLTDDIFKNPLVINIMSSTLKAYLPSLYMRRPKYLVKGKPEKVDDPQSGVEDSARLRQDTLNSYVKDRSVHFVPTTKLVTMEAQFFFGVSEVGYSASLVDNPNADRPVQRADGNGEYENVKEPKKLVKSEQFFIKRIRACNFRVNANSKPLVHENDWYGWYEWVSIKDIQADDSLENTEDMKVGETIDPDYIGYDEEVNDWKKTKEPPKVKLWTVIDRRSKERIVFAQGYHRYLRRKAYKVFPLQFLRHLLQLDSFYPIPPTSTWLGPQFELNFSRETQRIHNRKVWRRYLAKKGAIESSEVDKFISGGDGITAWRNESSDKDALTPVQEPQMDPSIPNAANNAYVDFAQVSGVPSESRGVAQSGTATQAAILNQRQNIIESASQEDVGGDYLVDVGCAWLDTLEAYATLPIWVERNVDPTSPSAPAEAQAVATQWKRIEHLKTSVGGYGYEVSVDVVNLSPVSEEREGQKWMQQLSVIGNPQIAMLLSMSPYLLRRTLEAMGAESGRDMAEIGRALSVMAQAAGAAGAPGTPAGGGGTRGGGSTGGAGGAGMGGAGPEIAAAAGAASQQ